MTDDDRIEAAFCAIRDADTVYDDDRVVWQHMAEDAVAALDAYDQEHGRSHLYNAARVGAEDALRERIAAAIEAMPGAREDGYTSAYLDGTHDAARLVRGGQS